MKKSFTAATTLILAASLTSCTGFGGAGSNALGSLIGGQSGNTAANVASSVAGALANGNTLSNLLSTFIGKTAVTADKLHGTWTYQGVDVAFESENLLARAGGAVAAGTIEQKLDEQLTRFGIKTGAVRFTFNPDNTFTANIGGKNISGTYTYDPATRKLTLNAALGLFSQTCTVGTTARGISLLFPADKLLSLLTTASTLLGNANSTLGSVSSLVSNYKGMQLGLELTR